MGFSGGVPGAITGTIAYRAGGWLYSWGEVVWNVFLGSCWSQRYRVCSMVCSMFQRWYVEHAGTRLEHALKHGVSCWNTWNMFLGH